MPAPGIHARLGADERQVDGDESDKDVVDDVETILNDLKEFRRHFFTFHVPLSTD